MKKESSFHKVKSHYNLRLIAYAQIALQVMLPLAVAFTPASAATSKHQSQSKISQSQVEAEAAWLKKRYSWRYHVIKNGETLALIANNEKLNLLTLRELNRYFIPSDTDFYALKTGGLLILPNWRVTKSTAPSKSSDALLSSVAGQVNSDNNAQQIAAFVARLAPIAQNDNSADAAKLLAVNSAAQLASTQIENWLKQQANTRISLNVDDKFHLDGSSADILLPLHDDNNILTYTQWGIHDRDSYTTLNMGLGQRWFNDIEMVGYNLFIDQELRNNHSRLGVGAEYWQDYLKFAANVYQPLTGWKESKQLDNYDEKAAAGYDLRADAYLPNYPQLGGKLAFEQYFGDEVALFGIDNRQKDPFALTMGVNYTPIPLVTTGIDYRHGKAGENDATFNLQLNYQFSVPWQQQISADSVKTKRMLAGSRLDFVDRNNNMVMQYRQNEAIQLFLPARIEGEVGQQLSVTASVQTRNVLDRIEWNTAALDAAGGSLTMQDNVTYQVKLPLTASNVILQAVAYDAQGNSSKPVSMAVVTNKSLNDYNIDKLEADKIKALVGDDIIYTVTTINAQSQPIEGVVVQWQTEHNGHLNKQTQESTTNAQGQATVTLTGNEVGQVSMVANLLRDNNGAAILDDNGKTISQTHSDAQFVNKQNISFKIEPVKSEAKADGMEQLHYTITALDAVDKPLNDQDILWTYRLPDAATDSSQTITTNSEGFAEIKLTSTKVGRINIKATALIGDSTKESSADGEFTDINYSMTLIAKDNKTTAAANGKTKLTYTLTARDSDGNLITKRRVAWEAPTDVAIDSSTLYETDANGQATVVLLSTTIVGKSDIKAVLYNIDNSLPITEKTNSVEFTKINYNLNSAISVNPATATADGDSAIVYTLEIKDQDGEFEDDLLIDWRITTGDAEIEGNTATVVDENGRTSVSVTDNTAETPTITATLFGKETSITSDGGEFIEPETPEIIERTIELNTDKDKQYTDNVYTNGGNNTITVTVKDKENRTASTEKIALTWYGNVDEFATLPEETDSNGQINQTLTFIGTKAGTKTLKVCLNDTPETSESCASKTVEVYGIPKIISYQPEGKSVTTDGDVFSGPRLKDGVVQLNTDNESKITDWTWSSNNAAAMVNDNKVILKSDSTNLVISATAFKEDKDMKRVAEFKLGSGKWVEFTHSIRYSMIGSSSEYSCPTGSTMSTESEASSVINTWGKIDTIYFDAPAVASWLKDSEVDATTATAIMIDEEELTTKVLSKSTPLPLMCLS